MHGENQPCTPPKRKFYDPRYFGEVASPDLATPRKAKRVMELARTQICRQKLKIRALQQKTARLERKCRSLYELINHLKQKNILLENAGHAIIEAVPENLKDLISRKLKLGK